MLAGKRFIADEEVIAVTDAYFDSRQSSIEKLPDRYSQFITLGGNYDEQ